MIAKLNNRGILMISVMLITVFLFVLGYAYLSTRGSLMSSAESRCLQIQARALAEAGLEDARVKLMKDYAFPPPASDGQTDFSYYEPFYDIGGTTPVGGYQVTIDSKYSKGPYFVLRLTCVGLVGNKVNPDATCTVAAEMDVSVADRSQVGLPNPINNINCQKFLRVKVGVPQ